MIITRHIKYRLLFILIAIGTGLPKSNAQLYTLTSLDYYIYFDSDSYSINRNQLNLLNTQIITIGGSNIKKIYVEGHTDTFATDVYNDVLAGNRAQAVVDALLDIGVPQRFIKTESFGESQLISEEQKNNRRAKVYFVYETDRKSQLNPPKFIVVKTVDRKTKKPVKADLGFDYAEQEMKFSKTKRNGISPTFDMLGEKLTIMASAPYYLSQYKVVPKSDMDKPIDTLVYTIELSRVKITEKLTFNNIYFFTDSDKIKPESSPELHKLLAALQRRKTAFVEIQGHMNYPINRATNSVQIRYNKELSFKRAKAINDYLVVGGIDQKRLTYKGMSNTRMKFRIPASRAEEDQNKRVEVYLLKEI